LPKIDFSRALGAGAGELSVSLMLSSPAALRDFDPANVADGSIASDRHVRDARPMSAMAPIATELWHRSETSLRAMNGLMHCGKSDRYSITRRRGHA